MARIPVNRRCFVAEHYCLWLELPLECTAWFLLLFSVTFSVLIKSILQQIQ